MPAVAVLDFSAHSNKTRWKHSYLDLSLSLSGGLLLGLNLGSVLIEHTLGHAVGVLHGSGPPRGLGSGADGKGRVVAAEEVSGEEEGGDERGPEESESLHEVKGGAVGVGDLLKPHADAGLGLWKRNGHKGESHGGHTSAHFAQVSTLHDSAGTIRSLFRIYDPGPPQSTSCLSGRESIPKTHTTVAPVARTSCDFFNLPGPPLVYRADIMP